jgi:long-chain acyl-CoA synthetase
LYKDSCRRTPTPDSSPSKLIEYLDRAARLDAEFIVYDDGYRGSSYRYVEIASMADALRARFHAEGIRNGDVAMLWSESRPGWVAALWACLVDGIILVPVDPQSSPALFHRIEAKAQPKIILIGDRQPAIESSIAPIWRLEDIEADHVGRSPRTAPDPPVRPADQPHPSGWGSGSGVPVQPHPSGWGSSDPTPPPTLDSIAEIVFTSGTTAEPKGVIITHRNLLANLDPVAGEIAKYKKYAGPFQPLRILNLLPLSHLFGQSLALLIPPLIPTSVVFITGTGAQEIARQIHSRRVSALVAVPKILEVLRDFVSHRFPEVNDPALARGPWPLRWWRFRRVHRLFGWKFWAFISGGAPLAPDVEQFWSRLGYLVVQGYGLTETAPIVTLSHPFHVREGTVGKPLAGVELKIAGDGEVLVRGGNVTTGYYGAPEETAAMFEDGWLRTGDIGQLDSEGHLQIRGRKKEMIVTPEGLKIFPEDVEKTLNQIPGVRDSAVIGKDRVHAVLVLEPGATADEIVREANQRLEDHQKIRSFSIWTGPELPRTQSTRKLRRAEIGEAVAKGKAETGPRPASDLEAILQKYAPGRTITPETTLDELGLSSLDRVQLMMDLEQRFETGVDERVFTSASKVADLEKPPSPNTTPLLKRDAPQAINFPIYNRRWLARATRRLALPYWLLPLARIFAHIRVTGRENLGSVRGPVIFASNHQSYFDVPVILASLPTHYRYRVATAMAKEFFDAHFFPAGHKLRERFFISLYYRLSTFFFNAFPIPQRQAGAGETIRYMGELVEEGWSILIFPEGDRTTSGEIHPFQPGVGMLASHLHLPVVPIRIEGLDRVLNRNARWPHPGRVNVRIGKPLDLHGDSFAELAKTVEQAVRAL